MWIYSLFIHINCWILQILGHYIFEKKTPAFIKSLLQSFLIAPYFVLLECMIQSGYF